MHKACYDVFKIAQRFYGITLDEIFETYLEFKVARIKIWRSCRLSRRNNTADEFVIRKMAYTAISNWKCSYWKCFVLIRRINCAVHITYCVQIRLFVFFLTNFETNFFFKLITIIFLREFPKAMNIYWTVFPLSISEIYTLIWDTS